MPGLIDMPSAVSFDDGMLQSTFGFLPGTSRVTLAFQVTPRLTASFRYSRIERPGAPLPVLYDRSFDLHYRLLDEGGWWPSIAIGLRDFIGTGIYSSEYIVATRHLTPRLRVTGGLGWGRLATHGGFRNPLAAILPGFETRPDGFSGLGGRLELNRFFRGDAAFFGGVEWQATDRLRLVAEYSSDAYVEETAPGARWEQRSPFNFGASYRVSDATTLSAYVLHGSTFGLQASFTIRPDQPAHGGLRMSAPLPVHRRVAESGGGDWSTSWASRPDAPVLLQNALRPLLEAEGLSLVSLQVAPTRAVVRFENLRHEAPARVIGRAARAMTRVFPASVEEFVLVPVVNGVAVSSVTLRRSDLERMEFAVDGTEALLARVHFADALPEHRTGLLAPVPEGRQRFAWSIGPTLALSFFDPERPVRADLSLRAEGRYALSGNLFLSGAVSQVIVGNIAGAPLGPAAPGYDRVRTSGPLYASESPTLDFLALEHFSRPGPDLFARLSFGYLERMYAGVSAEILWRPVDSRIALGAEIAQVRRRDPDSLFGMLDSTDTTTGHVSAYWDIGNGFHTQISAGRYLAGDWGATFLLEREFANGWRVGAFATLTDMPFEVFGESSFDKGITLTIPLSWALGQPSRSTSATTIRSLTRDGGAFLEVPTRLYPVVRELQRGRAEETWGSVWQ